MTRDEVKELCRQIFMFYPKFEARPEMMDAWAERMKELPYDVAISNLHKYIEQDDLGRIPTISRLMRTDLVRGVDFNEKYRENMKLYKYDNDGTYIDQNGLLWAYPTE